MTTESGSRARSTVRSTDVFRGRRGLGCTGALVAVVVGAVAVGCTPFKNLPASTADAQSDSAADHQTTADSGTPSPDVATGGSGGTTSGASGGNGTGGMSTTGSGGMTPAGTGGTATGGVPATGGAGGTVVGSGGRGGTTASSGGASASGGRPGTGGAVSTGGKANTGGMPASGGAPATGGAGTGGAGTGGAPACTGSTPMMCGSTCVNTNTDAKHCGRCNHDCLGGACAAGTCQPVQLFAGNTLTSFSSVLIDSTYVYWNRLISDEVEVISRMRQDGSAPIDLFTTNMGRGGPLAIDAQFIYWKAPMAGELRVCQLPDCAGGFRAAATSQPGGGEVITDTGRGRVFWGNRNGGTDELMTNPANPTPIYSSSEGIGALATDGSYVYFTRSNSIQRVPVSGGTTSTSIANGLTWSVLKTNSSSLFFGGDVMDTGGNRQPAIFRVPLVTGGIPTLVGYYPGGPGGLLQATAVEEQFVYWMAQDYVGDNTAHLLRCPVGGCGSSPNHLANVGGGGDSSGIATSDTAIFWSVKQTIFKLAK